MESWQWAMLGLKLTWTLFVFAYGACVGSLINVVAYRLPLGMSVVTPPSRCPSCQTRLTWRENIPVLGWVLLRGRCRFCKARVSPEYPIVEASVGLLFALFYVLYYFVPGHAPLLGIDWGAIRPEWYRNDASLTWPTFVLLLVLLGSLVAATIVDAKTSTIPLPIVWIPAAAALVMHTGHALWVGSLPSRVMMSTPGWSWAIPTPQAMGWGWIGVALGGAAGLVVSNALLASGLITRSFADYAEWERGVTGGAAPVAAGAAAETAAEPASGGSEASAAVDDGAGGGGAGGGDRPEDMWIQYPHARREMVKELAFLCAPVVLGIAGWFIATHLAGMRPVPGNTGVTVSAALAPLWLQVVSGVLLGYMVGGGVVWAVRVFGSLGFGKEAMGLGDVHLMAAVGACLGWIDATLAFFGAAFVGVAWTVVAAVAGGRLKRAMPYGPFLAVATVLVLLCKPAIEVGLGRLLQATIDLP